MKQMQPKMDTPEPPPACPCGRDEGRQPPGNITVEVDGGSCEDVVRGDREWHEVVGRP